MSSEAPFFDRLPTDTVVVVCIHVLQEPETLDAIFHTEDGALTMLCELEHDGEARDDFRAIRAGDVTRAFPITKDLADLPINHVAELEEAGWEIESLADDGA